MSNEVLSAARSVFNFYLNSDSTPVQTTVQDAESGDDSIPPSETTSESEQSTFSSDLVPLVEAERVKADGSARIKIISPGWGSSGYYSDKVLKQSAPIFAEGTHIYLDHPTKREAVERPERSVKDLAGTVTSTATYDENGSDGPGLYADVKFRKELSSHINEIAPHVGMSIRAMGTRTPGEAEGKTGMLIDSINDASSIDVVTIPGAGGAITELLESVRIGTTEPEKGIDVPPENSTPATEPVQEANPDVAALQEQMAQLRSELMESKATQFVQSELNKYTLADPIRSRLMAQLIATPALNESGSLDIEKYSTRINEAVKAESAYIAQLTGVSGRISGMGSTETAEPMTEAETTESLAEAFQNLGMGEAVAVTAAKGR